MCTVWTTNNDDILDRMKTERFDVAVVDGLFLHKCIYLIPHRLQIPWITYCDWVDPLTARSPWLPSFVPSTVLPYSETMSFFQRLTNAAVLFGFSLVYRLAGLDPPPEIINKYQQYGSFSSVDDLMSRSLLWLYTKDIVMNYPLPLMPNMIEIGGLTVKRAAGKLPPDIENFIDGAENGTVLITFGTMVASYSVTVAEKFLSAFRRLDGYRVVWRMRNTDRLNIPDNVMIAEWLPQNDILAHPSVKLFITHCGNNGMHEAVYHGVPMIGFPVGGDQIYNAKLLVRKGYGLSMDLYRFTADELLDGIHGILAEASYKERVVKASQIFRSQAQTPVERATFWIEHVCRFGGEHLRSAGNDLPVYSYFMLDVLAFLLIILHVVVYLLYKLLAVIANKCRRRTDANCTKKKNN